ncbi:MAG: glycerate kinase [Anaerolineales bacterium]|nr:glycerate kinase [Anaerolineales bacterium]
MIKSSDIFLTRSLREKPWGEKAARIMASALAAVDPKESVKKHLGREKNILQVVDQNINLDLFNSVTLLAVGKAALPMALGAAEILSEKLTRGFILTKPGDIHVPEEYQNKLKLFFGGHPIPNQGSVNAAAEIIHQLSGLTEHDLVIVLISGGGSTLFSAPEEGITLTDLQQTNRALMRCGANIQEINTIRKHLSRVKGGQLARIIHPAKTFSLVLSDVIGDPLDMIASGPTVPDRSTFQDAVSISQKYHLRDAFPQSVNSRLESGSLGGYTETPKPGDSIFRDQINLVIGSNHDAIQGAVTQAIQEGFQAGIIPDPLSGEARLAGVQMAKVLKQMAQDGNPLPRPACLIAGGETTVTLNIEDPGLGGRNLETALSAVRHLAGLKNAALITLATDGEDGITDAAGAVVTGETFTRANEMDLNPDVFLKEHNAYPFFESLDDLLLPGVTQTNVNDLCFLFTF